MATAVSKRNHFWFGTIDSMRWFPTPNSGADATSEGWESGGALLDGGGYQAHSFGSHGNYIYEWPPSSSQETAQVMKSYRDGTFGRGLLYFVDPLQFHTNILPPYWADPSMTLDGEVLNLAKEPILAHVTEEPTPSPDMHGLPVKSARYDLDDVLSGWRGTGKALFVPIPKDHSLLLGAMYTHTGLGRVLMRKVYHDGELGPVLEVPARSTAAVEVADIVADSSDSKGIYLFIGKTGIGAGSVTLSAMIGRLIETRKTTSQSVATNLFTNPNLVGDGTWAEVRRNLVTNPSFEAGLSGWFYQNVTADGSDEWASSGQYSLRQEGSAAGNNSTVYRTLASLGLEEGKTYTAMVNVYLPAPLTGDLNASALSLSLNSSGSPGAYAPNEAGVHELRFTFVAPLSSRSLRMYHGAASDGGVSYWDDLLIVEGVYDGPYFDGSTIPETAVGVDQPEDFRWRWLGTPNDSESVMEIERVAGVFGNAGSIPGVSSWGNKPAIRSIPMSDTNGDSSTRFSLPPNLRSGGTTMATVHIKEPLTGTLHPSRLSVGVTAPFQFAQAPNEAGSYSLRAPYEALTGSYQFVMFGGARRGGGDVWWTDIGLFAGNYTGPWFSGSSGGVVIDGKNYTPLWDGEPNSSTSTAWTPTPELDRLRGDPWIGGQGHSGCRFAGVPTYVKYSGVNGGQVGFAATFREVGHWTYN